jgi:hypothetical protein
MTGEKENILTKEIESWSKFKYALREEVAFYSRRC